MNVLVIGSSSIDLFAKPVDEEELEESDNKVSFNLGDKIPVDVYSLSLGGNASNVSSGLKSLGCKVTLYTFLGNDILSSHIKNTLEKRGIELIVEEENSNASSMSFILNLKGDRVIFSHHSNKRYSFDEGKVKSAFDMIYLTSMGEGWENAYQKILVFAKSKNVPIAFSPGSHQLNEITEAFFETLKNSKILMCNMSEAKKILEAKGISSEDPKKIFTHLKSLGPEILSITEGDRGAFAVDDKNNIFHIEPLVINSHEKTGAGDAYASGFLGAFIKGKSAEEAMIWGSVNSYSVMQKVGAQNGLATEDEINEYIKNHQDFKAQKI